MWLTFGVHMTIYPYDLKAESADIALILESSYPYILGGVSNWVEQIIHGFPQYTFALIFLGGAPQNYQAGIRYKIADNVTHFQVNYLFDEDEPVSFLRRSSYCQKIPAVDMIRDIHHAFCQQQTDVMNSIGRLELYEKGTGFDYDQFLHSEDSWQLMTQLYTENCKDTSFIDYVWTVRNLHKPLWKLAELVKQFPKVNLVHTASTGYAGLLSFLIHQHHQYPVVLSEHGIYTRERRIDVFLSNDFRDDFVIDRPLADASYLRNLWDRYFRTIAQLCYNIADPIVSLSGIAHQIQLEEGAPQAKTQIIPNGIDIDHFASMQRTHAEKTNLVCFVGRLVPMKDVKGFIRAIPSIKKAVDNSAFWIIGSVDQHPQYAKECHELVENIDLQHTAEFKLHQNMQDVLPKAKVLVLSAIREGMPFIILESFAAGVPVVATDVGACKEMILGLSPEDQALGPAGIVVKVADTAALEQAIIELLTNQELWIKMQQSAIKRAQKYYDLRMILAQYQTIYEENMRSWQASDSH